MFSASSVHRHARRGNSALTGKAPRRLPTLMQADFLEDVKTRLRIAQESQKSGASFKQIGANVIAGEYDAEAVRAELDGLIKSSPSVMFTWAS